MINYVINGHLSQCGEVRGSKRAIFYFYKYLYIYTSALESFLEQINRAISVGSPTTVESQYNVIQGTGAESRYFENHVESRLSNLSHYSTLLYVFFFCIFTRF